MCRFGVTHEASWYGHVDTGINDRTCVFFSQFTRVVLPILVRTKIGTGAESKKLYDVSSFFVYPNRKDDKQWNYRRSNYSSLTKNGMFFFCFDYFLINRNTSESFLNSNVLIINIEEKENIWKADKMSPFSCVTVSVYKNKFVFPQLVRARPHFRRNETYIRNLNIFSST